MRIQTQQLLARRGRDKKFVITLVVGTITILLAVWGLWEILHEDVPSISVLTVNRTNVLDVHEPIEELTILFREVDIQKENLNLCIYTIRVVNDGEVNILQNYYAQEDIWGIQISDGNIIETRLVDSSSEYIRTNINPTVGGEENIVQFRKILFDKQQYFVLDILVLHERDKLPEIIPIGKIAGIDEIRVAELQAGRDEQDFLSQVIDGDVWVHSLRFIMYLFAIAIIGFVAIVIAAIVVASRTPKTQHEEVKPARKRRKPETRSERRQKL